MDICSPPAPVQLKCGGNYAASMIAQTEGEKHGCKQVIFMTRTAATPSKSHRRNVFFIFGKENKIVTRTDVAPFWSGDLPSAG